MPLDAGEHVGLNEAEAAASVEGASTARRGARRARPTAAERGWWDALGLGGSAKIAVIAALLLWLYWDQCYRMFTLWRNPDWSHGYLIPAFCLWMLHARKEELLSGEHRGSLAGLVVLIGAIAGYALAIRMKIGYPQALSMIIAIAGLVLLLRGWRTLKLSLFPIMFLLLAIPPPDRLYRQITQPLQQGAATISAWVLNLFPGSIVEQAGINIAYYMERGNHGMFTVAGACSGMRSLMAFIALGLAMAYFTPRPVWQRVAMALFVVPVALFCNVLRVISTGAFQMYEYGDLATGTPHTVLGLLMFALGFMIYLAILWVMDHLYTDVPDPKPPVRSTGTMS